MLTDHSISTSSRVGHLFRVFGACTLLALLALFVSTSYAEPSTIHPELALAPMTPALQHCQGLIPVLGLDLCTHGFDPEPPDVRYRSPLPPIVSAAQTRAATVTCDGDGVSGNRVQVMYVHPPERNRYSEYLASFQVWASGMDDIFYQSALATGGTRHVRFVHDAGCNPTVLNVQVSSAAMSSTGPWTMWNEVNAQGYDRIDRKYLIFADTTGYNLGIGTFEPDEQFYGRNGNNQGPSYTSTPPNLWGPSNPAHELMHNLGGVQLHSPNSTGYGHCRDENDRMCYVDAPGVTMISPPPCPNAADEQRFDCNHDDYYHTNPPAGSYLATNWNPANNSFLIGAVPPPSGPTKTWSGAGSTTWSAPGNWNGGTVPSTGDNCLIPAGAPHYPVIASYDSAECSGTLTIANGGQVTVGTSGGLAATDAVISGTVQVLDGSYFDLASGGSVRSGGTLLLQTGDIGMEMANGGTLSISGTLQVTGTFPIYGTSSAPANVNVNPGGLLEILSGGSLTVDGTVTNNGTMRQTEPVNASATTGFLNIGTKFYSVGTRYCGVDITLGAVGNIGTTTVTIDGQGCSSTGSLRRTVRRCYRIAPTTARASTVKFYYNLAENGCNLMPNAYRYNGAAWDALTSTRGGSGEASWTQASSVSNYANYFALHDSSTACTMLPLLWR